MHTIYNTEIKYGLNLLTNPQSVTDKFNSHFINIILELKQRTKLPNLTQGLSNHNLNSLCLAPVTEYEIKNTIRKLENSYSMRHDEFPEIIITNCGHYLIKPLAYIYNLFSKWYHPQLV
jgi:hypothetical protein